MARYIAELGEDPAHPLLSRRARDFRYAGSWSSRLRDCGFHVNHIHHEGWISSCYYVALPDAVKDESARQGWIKFGEPALEVALERTRSGAPFNRCPASWCCFRPICGTAPCRSAIRRRGRPSRLTWCRSAAAAAWLASHFQVHWPVHALRARPHLSALAVCTKRDAMRRALAAATRVSQLPNKRTV